MFVKETKKTQIQKKINKNLRKLIKYKHSLFWWALDSSRLSLSVEYTVILVTLLKLSVEDIGKITNFWP